MSARSSPPVGADSSLTVKVRGRAEFVGDGQPPGTLHVAVVTSPHPHARIVAVDASAARHVAGVHAVLDGRDVRGIRFGRRLQDRPVLAWERARCVGDRLAAVAAETQAQAERAAAAIRIKLEPLQTIRDPREALLDTAPVLHPDAHRYAYLGGERPLVRHPNLQGTAEESQGDGPLSEAFARAVHVSVHTFSTPAQHHGAIEPHDAVVWLDGGTVHVRSTSKDPVGLRRQLSVAIGVPEERILLHSVPVGGDFGGKGYAFDEALCYLLACVTGRPVRSTIRYPREFSETNVRHAARVTLRTGVDDGGRIVAHHGHLLLDGGAYAAAKLRPALTVGHGLDAFAAYDVPRATVETDVVYTNHPPGGHVRAPGMAQAVFGFESHLDLLAGELGLDPLELRRRNVRPTRRGHPRYDDVRAAEVVTEVARTWARPAAAPAQLHVMGRGLAIHVHRVGGHGARCTLEIEVDREGGVRVWTGVPDQGAGSEGVVAAAVGRTLGLAPERVVVERADALVLAGEPGAGASRGAHLLGAAAASAAAALQDRLRGCQSSGARPPAPDFLASAAAMPEATCRLRHTFRAPDGVRQAASTAALVVDVEVDAVLGEFTVRSSHLFVDVGAVLDPRGHEGQLRGGFVFGLGAALTEQVRFRDGVVATTGLRDYGLLTAGEVPELDITLLPGGRGPGVAGAKAVGELVNPLVAPAVANAVADAVGVRVRSLPITSDRIHQHLQARGAGAASASSCLDSSG